MAGGNEFESREEEYKALVEKEQKLRQELREWERKCSRGNKMALLHKYNDIKDATQILLGAIANMEGVTVKELHERFQLPIKD